MKRVLVVWQSMTGGARQMADAAACGAARAEVEVDLRAAIQAAPEHLLGADGYLFVTPENLGTMAGLMKDFFDRNYYPVLDLVAGRPYATLVCAGTDGSGAARQIERIATGWRLKAMCPPLIVKTGAQSPEAILAPKTIGPEDLARCAELGETLAAGLAGGIL